MTWESIPLAKLAVLNPHSDSSIEPGTFLGMADVSENGTTSTGGRVEPGELKSGYTPFRDRDILVAKITPCFENGKIAQATLPTKLGWGSTEFHVVRPNRELLHDRYALHYLRTSWVRANGTIRMTGSAGQRRVPLAFLQSLEIPLPPLPEQRRIAAILDGADTLDRPATNALGKLSALRQSLFAGAVSEVRTRATIADVALKVTDGTHQAPGWSTTGVPFLFVSNITSGSIDYSTTKYVSPETYDRLTRHSPIERGDVLYSAVGSYGVPAVVDSDQPFLFQRHIAHIKPRPDVVDSWYLHAALGSSDFLNQAHRVARGVAQKTVTLGDLSRLTIPLPSVESQRHVAEQLEAVRRAHASITQQRSSIRTLFSSLQHRAFRGEL